MAFRKHLCQGVSLQCVMAYHLLQVDIFNFLIISSTWRISSSVRLYRWLTCSHHYTCIQWRSLCQSKLFHSINIQAICDHEFRFIDSVVMWPGSTHDAFIWRQSAVKEKLSNGTIPTVHGWLLGDSAYGLITNLMTPIPSPTTPGQRRYNRAFVKVRKIECYFVIWKSRWRSMDKTGVSFLTVRKSVVKLLWQLWYCITSVLTMALTLSSIQSMKQLMTLSLPILQEMAYWWDKKY